MKIEGLENAIMIEIYHRYKDIHRIVVLDTVENVNKFITKVREQDSDDVLVFVVHECLCTESRIGRRVPDDLQVKGL